MAREEFSQFAVIGLGRFGRAVARKLFSLGKDVLAVDSDQQLVSEIADSVTHSLAADTTDEAVLRSIGIRNYDVVVVAIGSNMQDSILTTLMCKEMGVKTVVAKAQNEQHKKVLERIGADMVIFPEESSGIKLAAMLASPNVVEVAALAEDFKIVEVVIPDSWENKSLIDLRLRQKYSINLMLVKRNGQVIMPQSADFTFEPADIAIVCGYSNDLNKLHKLVD